MLSVSTARNPPEAVGGRARADPPTQPQEERALQTPPSETCGLQQLRERMHLFKLPRVWYYYYHSLGKLTQRPPTHTHFNDIQSKNLM